MASCVRINKADNLAVEVGVDDEPHAELVLQDDDTVDLGTRARPWDPGDKGWDSQAQL